MATQFQNRLVGTLVLVSLGVIFLPDVFDGEKTHYQENFQAIPLQEPFDQQLVSAPLKEPDALDSYQPPQGNKNDDSFATNNDKLPLEGYKDSAWVIRLGAFRNIENAQSLVIQLQNKGYRAQLMPRHIKEGELGRVEIGPDISKSKLETMISDIESLTGLKGQLLRFNPLNP